MGLRELNPCRCGPVYPHVFDSRWDVPETIVRKEQPRALGCERRRAGADNRG